MNNNNLLSTPVLFMIFNRPELTRQVFETIRHAKPSRLYVAADGPRKDRADDTEKCAAARKVIQQVDWECEVNIQFRDENLGCGVGVTAAISWFFEHETEGIILEDDCYPSAGFFRFCAELLKRYREDTRVMMIAGNNCEKPATREGEYSYTFSGLTYIWGWATWRRAWKLHDYRMRAYGEFRQKNYQIPAYHSIYERDFFTYVFDKMYEGDSRTDRKNIWDYQWQFACMIHSGLIAVPNQNLVINLGFGIDATNTLTNHSYGSDLILEEIDFPLHHPEFVMIDRVRDMRNFKTLHTSAISRFKSKVKQLIPKVVVKKVIRPLLQSIK